jgi:hypothetical protein
MCVAVNSKMQFRQIRRRSWPCFLTFHSPSPEDLQPGGINHQVCDFTPVDVLKLTLTDFARLPDISQLVDDSNKYTNTKIKKHDVQIAFNTFELFKIPFSV